MIQSHFRKFRTNSNKAAYAIEPQNAGILIIHSNTGLQRN